MCFPSMDIIVIKLYVKEWDVKFNISVKML